MDQTEIIRKAEEYIKLIREILFLRKAVLFGSYANGNPQSFSDIDIGLFIDSLDPDDDYFHLMERLYELADDIDVRIEPHLFIKSEDRSGFSEEIERTGITIG
ncbi:MAG: nucleotidyltransferase domain-containing protein [Candidatus Schekmanbacteria bacterium]|nr:nucleotidyltransferase domain-containing protein [Candidatus Schekmanbacteria bacterium]